MNIADLVAVDVHTHAEVSCRQPVDVMWEPYEEAASMYFKVGKRPTIAETLSYYRERKIGLVMFTVDAEAQIGNRRIPNAEVIDAVRDNSDIMIAFASIDPHKGMMGAREARELIEGGIVRGFKFHPTCQGFFPTTVWPTSSTRSSRSISCRRFFTPAIPASAPACAAAEDCG
jgi:uncharacterized protein